jgi:large subunit ribosomal protein L15
MVVRKQKKVTKYRGSKTHGGGSMKKRRGAGHRGGRGRAGSGKRGDAKKPRYWKETPDKGFASHIKDKTTTNVGHVSSTIESLVRRGKATEKSGAYTLNLTDLGVHKLLGSGVVLYKLTLTVDHASARAIEKIEAAGGSVTVQAPEPASAE